MQQADADFSPRADTAGVLTGDGLVGEELGAVKRDLFGLALSGGGIRSATFNLGLMQGLRKVELLQRLDYLSTVSGGGYIGGFWTAWRHRNRQVDVAGFPQGAAGAGSGGQPGVEHPAVRHLRRFSNFLSPRLGVFSYDTGRLAVAALTGAIPTLLAALSLLLLGVAVWRGAADALASTSALTWGLALGAIMAATFVVFEAAWQGRERQARAAAPAVRDTPSDRGRYAVFAATATVLAVGAFLVQPASPWRPVVAWSAAFVLLAIARMVGARFADSFERAAVRATLDRVLSRLLFLAVAWSVVLTLWLVSGSALTILDTGGMQALYAAATALFTGSFLWTRKLGGDEPSRPFGSALAARLKPRLPQILAYGVVILVVLGVMMGFRSLAADGIVLGVGLAAAATITGLTLVFFHPNRVGLHAFYRGRLARAYLGASRPDREGGGHYTEEAKGDDIPLHELFTVDAQEANGPRDGAAPEAKRPRVRPVHLVCCAVNDLAPRDALANMQRGAASAVLTPYGLGVSETHGTGERATGLHYSRWQNGSPTLGGAITASGAAFNSMMGAFSVRLGPAATFVLAMLNLRLGMWLQHPRRFHAEGAGSPAESWLPGRRFYKELFGLSSADGADVHLSDGGHFENTAVYELIRRGCRYIVASDCGADPDRAYDDVANLIRRVRQDFGVEIRIDLSPLRLDDARLALQPMVAGDIHYPSGDVGVLLLFKPTLTGSEPPDIAQYRTRNEAFPNESTGDQFYDEAQWESYRRLGEHAADTAFAFLRGRSSRLAPAEPHYVAQAFALARFMWLPKPPQHEERMRRFAERAGELDAGIVASLRDGVSVTAQAPPDTPPAAGLIAVRTADTGEAAAAGAPLQALVQDAAAADAAAAQRQQLALHDALLALRRGMLFMEETYHAWDLERTHGEPLCLGVMNCFGRWAGTPLLRTWWPLLKGLHSPNFTHFVESRFGLVGIQPSDPDGGMDDVITRADEPDPTGFARTCWEQEAGPRTLRPGVSNERFIGYRLRMMRDGREAYALQAALLRAGRTDRDDLYWDARDFFVPAGLWGIGIGEDFLKRLAERQYGYDGRQWVRLQRPNPGDVAAARSAANLRRMYEAAGFAENARGPDGVPAVPDSDWLARPPLPGA